MARRAGGDVFCNGRRRYETVIPRQATPESSGSDLLQHDVAAMAGPERKENGLKVAAPIKG
jgi:hypothetical protein